jgi:tRNA modification GTPase
MIDNTSKIIEPKIRNLINEDCIVVLNKSDIQSEVNHNFKSTEVVLVSVKENKNIIHLTNLIIRKLSKKFTMSNNILVTRERHRDKLNACLKEINNFLKKDQRIDIEMAAEDLRMATRHLGGIVGKVDVEEILGSIFKDFCIGK